MRLLITIISFALLTGCSSDIHKRPRSAALGEMVDKYTIYMAADPADLNGRSGVGARDSNPSSTAVVRYQSDSVQQKPGALENISTTEE